MCLKNGYMRKTVSDMAQYKDADAILRQLDEYYITAIVQQKHDDVPEDHKKHWRGVQSGINYARNTIIEAPTGEVVPKSEWISVDDRLPEEDTIVLVWCGEVSVYNYLRYDWWYTGYCDITTEDGGITHWMPLPEPPKDYEF